MNILGLTSGHDASAALFSDGRLIAYCKEERLSRKKQDAGPSLRQQAIAEVLLISGCNRREIDAVCFDRGRIPARCFKQTSRPISTAYRKLFDRPLRVQREMARLQQVNEFAIVDANKVRRYMGLRSDVGVRFCNHHFSHALGAFKFTTWERDALYVVCDAMGDGTSYAAYSYDGYELKCLVGGDSSVLMTHPNYATSIGFAYSYVTQYLKFRPNRHEGKITGLAASGQPLFGQQIRQCFRVDQDGHVGSVFASGDDLAYHLSSLFTGASAKDIAASVQWATEKLIVDWVNVLLKIFPARFIGMSGGVFSNVRLNQRIAELNGVEEVFIFPAMSDEGLSIGNCVFCEIEEHGLNRVARYKLRDVYFGRRYKSDDLLSAAHSSGFQVAQSRNTAAEAASLLAAGSIGAIFSQRMEMGPRALGARSIIASPHKHEINDVLNKRLQRTEFMPFAPYVLEEDAPRVFNVAKNNAEACKFMTITTSVHKEYQDLIPGVVHVDGTARPQVIERDVNSLYYDILVHFKRMTGLPCLINTSFNAHEEPIINTPQEAVRALTDGRIDFLICEGGFALNKLAIQTASVRFPVADLPKLSTIS
jgi:carbamoyltransferase